MAVVKTYPDAELKFIEDVLSGCCNSIDNCKTHLDADVKFIKDVLSGCCISLNRMQVCA